jgi:hypothetical protein
MSKLQNTRRLCVESMESRQLLAGNVFASVVAGDLVLTGDNAANGVEVRQLGAGVYRVIGLNYAGAQTNIWQGGVAANSHIVFGVNDDFHIALNGGDDYLLMTAAGLPAGARMQVPDQLLLRTGDGNDRAILSSVQIRDDASIDLGNGNDYLYMYNGFVGGSPISPDNDLNVYGSAGNDFANIYSTFVRDDLFMNMGLGDDRVSLTSMSIADDAWIYTVDGNDLVTLNRVTVRDSLTIDTGDGKDAVYLSFVRSDELYTSMGNGDGDYLRVDNTHANTAKFDGGPGVADNIDLLAGNVFGVLGVGNFEL